MAEINKTLSQGAAGSELTVKDAVGLLASFAQAVNLELGQYMLQVAQLARKVGTELDLTAAQIEQVEMAGMICDIGLLGLPRELHNKPADQLTDKQYRLYCEHPVIAAITLEGIEALSPVGEIVLHHHEYMNGKGFPNGLAADQIPLGSRILLVVSDYCRIMASWPRNMRQLISHVRRHLIPEDWKRLTFDDDPESIIEASAHLQLLRNTEGVYDAGVVKALIRFLQKEKNIQPADLVPLEDLESGMVLMDDLHMEGGRLLITKGTKLVAASVQTLQALGERGLIPRKICVAMPGQADPKVAYPPSSVRRCT